MSKTYLQLVNKVMVNLRETSNLSAVNANTYSSLIGEFVNQAKEAVEDSWDWSALTTEMGFTTNLQQCAYYLDNLNTNNPVATSDNGRYPDERSYILKDDREYDQVFDTTNASNLVLYQLRGIPYERAKGDLYLQGARTATNPYLFCYTWENGRPVFYMVNPPFGGRTIAARMLIPQAELVPGVDEATTLLVPWRPVVSLATALAMQERGEELGQSADLYLTRYNAELLRAQEQDRRASKGRSSDQLVVEELGQNVWSLD